MELSTILILALVAAITIAFLRNRRKGPANFPPGPWGFPLVGHLPLLGLEPHKKAVSWIQKYGPVVGLRFGSFPCVFISDHRLARVAFALPGLAGRPKFQHSFDRSGAGQGHKHIEGIIFASGRTWREQRTFTHRRLREVGGFGTRSMEPLIVAQAHELVQAMRKEAEAKRPISTHAAFNGAIINSLWAILAGTPFAQSDPNLKRITHVAVEVVAETSAFSLLSMFMPPWFGRYLPRWLTGEDGLERMYAPFLSFLQPFVDEHWRSENRIPGTPRDFIDAYIDEIQGTTDADSSFHASRSKHSLPTVLLDLFLTGSETSATTLEWICLLLASYPHVQEKLATEIETVVGASASVSLVDRQRMPYTEAVIHEVMRFKPILPMGVYRSTTEPVRIGGFDIPQDTMVFINVWEAHNNRGLWGDPENFRPGRWISEDGSEFMRHGHEGFLPFSTGKRVCLGEQLARDELFLFTTMLFQAFRIELDPNDPRPSLDPTLGGTTSGPKPHTLIFKLRG